MWSLRKPGLELPRQAAGPILLVVFSLLGAVLFAYRRGTRSALALAASQAVSHRLAFHDQLTDLANRRLLNARLGEALAASALDGAPLALLLIGIELTERVLMADDLHTQDTLAALRALGFRLALDDFGTGYSSLSYLSRFPIDKIKIDKSFVDGLPGEKVAEALIRAIVQLARALGMDVIAEGVETPVQHQALAALGCRSVQGYLTGPPCAADEIDALFAASPPRGSRAVAGAMA